MANVPAYDALPPVEGMPGGCAWGVFDKPGEPKDVYGTLNHLTPAVVAAAAAEVRDGVSISLNWPLTAMNHIPMPTRRKTTHKTHTLSDLGMGPAVGLDDEVEFNTQSSSQWDSLVHWAHQPTGLSYNGFRATADNTEAPEAPTLDKWHARGGVVARGVLIDFKRWALQQQEGNEFHPFDLHRITVDEVQQIAAAQGVEFRPGDVLLIRTGATEVWAAPKPEDLAKAARVTFCGLHGAVETVRWLWDQRFAAVVTDTNSVEPLPPVRDDGSNGKLEELVLHPHCLGLLGMPLGELWDLSRLATHCANSGRYSFLLTSVPLNVPGLVGSPPNALAIF